MTHLPATPASPASIAVTTNPPPHPEVSPLRVSLLVLWDYFTDIGTFAKKAARFLIRLVKVPVTYPKDLRKANFCIEETETIDFFFYLLLFVAVLSFSAANGTIVPLLVFVVPLLWNLAASVIDDMVAKWKKAYNQKLASLKPQAVLEPRTVSPMTAIDISQEEIQARDYM